MASTNNFKIFDESIDNILTIIDYVGNTQRVNGFAEGDEIPSALFNSVLRQNTLVSYGLIEFMKFYVSSPITVQHNMNTTDLLDFITEFFDNYFIDKISDGISYSNIHGDNNATGGILYMEPDPSGSIGNYVSPPIGTPTSLKKFILGYKNYSGTLLPESRKLEIYEKQNNTFTNVNNDNEIGICQIDLTTYVANITSNFANYEILLELFEDYEMGNDTPKAYNSITIPLNRLGSLAYHESPPGTYTLTGDKNMVVFTPGYQNIIFIGLSSSTGDIQSPSIGKYLTLITTNIQYLQCIFNISLKERI